MKTHLTLALALLSFTVFAQTSGRPAWLDSKPAEEGYYVGIGSASKRLADYQGAAKKNALQDLVSDIRIAISSTSILSQIDKNYAFKEEYESKIKTTVADEIEDFERVATHEDDATYWVYYRLSKSRYQAQKQQNLADVKSISLQFFEKANAAEKNGSIATAIDFFFRSLLTLKDYWGENIEVTHEGKSLFLAVESYARLQQLLDQINIRPAASFVRIAGTNGRMVFSISHQTQPVSKIPVVLTASPQRGAATPYSSDEKGEVIALFSPSVWTVNTREAELMLDLKSFARASSEERFYDYLIRSLRVPSAKIAVEVAAVNSRMQPAGDFFPFYSGLVYADYAQAERYSFQNLRLVPLRMRSGFKEAVGNLGFYVSLHQAMLANQVVITEASTGGTVNTLIARNLSSDTLFLMSGEILQGGKQDRVIARDMLIPPGEGRVRIPVFCVEQGRWKYKGQSNDQKFSEYYGMANEHLRDIIDHRLGQAQVWDEVAKSNKRDGINSSTDAYTDHANNRSFRRVEQQYVDYFANLFNDDDTVIGVMAVTGNRVEGVDLFINNNLFRQEFQKLIFSYIDEAVTYGAPVNIRENVMEEYINSLLDIARQSDFIDQRGQAFRKGQQVIHISTF
jgi:hypothetical protein